ncbi:hypothetical protein BJ944DRAFT_267699 [Cunninghamella echinulata]|nr:hypothetical protein BJ944DRAFT_267699 [Cunninghamella echinulata]
MELAPSHSSYKVAFSDPLIVKTFITSLTLLFSWYLGWHMSGHLKTERQKAYVFSLLSSFLTSLGSLPLVYQVLWVQPGNIYAIILEWEKWSLITTVFFMTFLSIDLIVGSLLYRKQIGMLTGWIHHLTYLGLLVWVIKQRYQGLFIAMCVLEIPTFLLALGSVHKPFRHDMLFATAFVSTRILFHAFMIVNTFLLFRFAPMTIALTSFFPLHCYWFYGFILQQKRLSKAKKNKVSETQASSPLSIPKSEKISAKDEETSFSSSSSSLSTFTTSSLPINTIINRRKLSHQLRRHLPTTIPSSEELLKNLPASSQYVMQRLADSLPETIQRDLYWSSEKLRYLWDKHSYQFNDQPPSQQHNTPSNTVVAAH